MEQPFQLRVVLREHVCRSLVNENSDTFVMDVLDPSKKIWARARRKAKDLGWTQLMDWCVGERGDARAFIRCRAPSDARCSHFRPAARRRTHQGGHASSAHQNPGAPGRAYRGGAGEEERGRAALPERRQRLLHRLDLGSARYASHTAGRRPRLAAPVSRRPHFSPW